MPRLFAAIALPETVRAALASLAGGLDGVRCSRPENLHLTLRFIGEVGGEMQLGMEEALGRVRVEPFILPVSGVGIFPSRGPAKVLWAGLGGAHPRLFQLRKQVDEALLSVDPGLDIRSFHPHITLGRIAETCDPKALAKFAERHAGFEAPPFRVEEFRLMSSTQAHAAAAPDYGVVRSYQLETD